MHANLVDALDMIFLSEGGYAEKPSEPGGAVNRGISMLVYQEWRLAHDQPPPTFKDLENMSREEAAQIYESKYLRPCRFDQCQSGIDYCVADYAVNSGLGGHDPISGELVGALPSIRDALGFKLTAQVDERPWRMENDLLYALKTRPVEPMIAQICDRRWADMKAKPDFQAKARGRAKRMNAVYHGSRRLAGLPKEEDRYHP